jgi:hypothetical protein
MRENLRNDNSPVQNKFDNNSDNSLQQQFEDSASQPESSSASSEGMIYLDIIQRFAL